MAETAAAISVKDTLQQAPPVAATSYGSSTISSTIISDEALARVINGAELGPRRAKQLAQEATEKVLKAGSCQSVESWQKSLSSSPAPATPTESEPAPPPVFESQVSLVFGIFLWAFRPKQIPNLAAAINPLVLLSLGVS